MIANQYFIETFVTRCFSHLLNFYLLRYVAAILSLRQIHKMSGGPIETSIRTKISKALSPAHLEVINESTMHNVPPGSETHFKVVVVSEEFEGKMPLQVR